MKIIKKRNDKKEKGFDLMELEIPKIFNEPNKKVKLLNKFGMERTLILLEQNIRKNSLEEV